LGERHSGQSRGVVPHGEAAAKEWTSLKVQRVEGWRSKMVVLLSCRTSRNWSLLVAYLRWMDSGTGKGIVGRTGDVFLVDSKKCRMVVLVSC
jgi:hypothetical protein